MFPELTFCGRNAFDVSTFHRSNGIRDQGEISGAPPQREAARRVPDGPCRSSPEHSLRGLETTLGGFRRGLPPVPGWTGRMRSRHRGAAGGAVSAWRIGRSALRWLPQPVYAWRSGTLSATPRQPRIGGPLSTARGLSTVLRALPLARVRDVVCPLPSVDHVPAAAGQQLAAGNWSHSPWRFHRMAR